MSTDEHQIKCAVSFHKGKLLFTQRITKTFCSAGIFPQRSRQNIMKPLKTNPLM